jgi:hypothetical protein
MERANHSSSLTTSAIGEFILHLDSPRGIGRLTNTPDTASDTLLRSKDASM